MKKAIYKLEYKDFIGRRCAREYHATCIVSVINEAKSFARVNRISSSKVITPSGKIYYV